MGALWLKPSFFLLSSSFRKAWEPNRGRVSRFGLVVRHSAGKGMTSVRIPALALVLSLKCVIYGRHCLEDKKMKE